MSDPTSIHMSNRMIYNNMMISNEEPNGHMHKYVEELMRQNVKKKTV